MITEGEPTVPLETFKQLVEESLTGMYLVQHERLVYANPRLAAMFGYSREELLALPSVLGLIAEPDRSLVREKLRQRVSGEIALLEYMVRGLRKDGEEIELDVRSVATVHNGTPAVMGSMQDITSRRKLEDALRTLSLVDDLTGVYNRRGFMAFADRHLALARRHRRPLLLIFADLDSLKAINDTHGHAAGDQALIDAASVLRRTYRSADIVARLGGDEFTVFPLEAGPDAAELLLARLRDSLAAHNAHHQRPYVLSMTIGFGRFDPDRCQTTQDLLDEADREMYQRKRQAR